MTIGQIFLVANFAITMPAAICAWRWMARSGRGSMTDKIAVVVLACMCSSSVCMLLAGLLYQEGASITTKGRDPVGTAAVVVVEARQASAAGE